MLPYIITPILTIIIAFIGCRRSANRGKQPSTSIALIAAYCASAITISVIALNAYGCDVLDPRDWNYGKTPPIMLILMILAFAGMSYLPALLVVLFYPKKKQ
jgi:hypothetical protein